MSADYQAQLSALGSQFMARWFLAIDAVSEASVTDIDTGKISKVPANTAQEPSVSIRFPGLAHQWITSCFMIVNKKRNPKAALARTLGDTVVILAECWAGFRTCPSCDAPCRPRCRYQQRGQWRSP